MEEIEGAMKINKRIMSKVILATLLLTAILFIFTACASNNNAGITTFSGKLISQQINSKPFSNSTTDMTILLSDNTTYIIRVLQGQNLPLNQNFRFTIKLLPNGTRELISAISDNITIYGGG
jgi:hypothetical protein